MRFVAALHGLPVHGRNDPVSSSPSPRLPGLLWHYSKDLPDYSQLQNYEPAVMTRVHAADGSLLAEYAHERRLYIPPQAVPKLVTNAFVATEDKNFYEHNGLDFQGHHAGRPVFPAELRQRTPPGGGLIHHHPAGRRRLPAHQPAETTFSRKIEEALLAAREDRADVLSSRRFSNSISTEIYQGMGAYGVAAASAALFRQIRARADHSGKPPIWLRCPSFNNYNPFRRHAEAVTRRNYVIDRMAEEHYITAQEAEQVRKEIPSRSLPGRPGRAFFTANISPRRTPLYRRQLHRAEAL